MSPIESICQNLSSDSAEDMTAALRPLINSEFVIRLVDACLSDDQILSTIVNESYVHDNGFDKFVLRSSANYVLRLHVWWPGFSAVDGGNVHNHRWNFASCLIAGEYLHECYEIAPSHFDGTPFYHCIYKKDPTREGYVLAAQRNQHLRCYERLQMCKGHIYFLSHDRLHRVIVEQSTCTATLFLTSPAAKTHTDVFSERPLDTTRPFQHQRIERKDVMQKLKRLREAVCL